jgi:hypothetical protein
MSLESVQILSSWAESVSSSEVFVCVCCVDHIDWEAIAKAWG